MLRAIIFDMDGVLCDSEPLHMKAFQSVLKELGIASVDLITNNPLKLAGLAREGVRVRRRIPSVAPLNPHNVEYLRTKRDRTGHLIELFADEDVG